MDSMKENVLEWIKGNHTITATLCSQTKLNTRVRKLSEKYPEQYKIIKENEDGSIIAKIPKKCITIREPSTRSMSEEQRAASAERLKRYREQRKQIEDCETE